MSILSRNKFLEGAQAAVEAKLLPKTKADYDKIVVAGMRASMHGGPNSMLAKLQTSKDVVQDSAAGAISLVMILSQQSKGQMPVEAQIPASATLMLQALDFAEKAKMLTVGEEDVARGTKMQGNIWLHFAGLTPEKLQAMAEKTHGIMQDPTQMDLVARTAGVVKDPRVSVPTELPMANAKGARNVTS